MAAATTARLLKKAGLNSGEPILVRQRTDVEVGQKTASYRVLKLQLEFESVTQQLAAQLPQLNQENANLKKLRVKIIEDTFGKAPRITQLDRLMALRSSPEYFERLDAAMIQSAKLLRASQRCVTKLREMLQTECKEVNKDWAREKVEMLLAMQTESTIGMHFTDIEGLITLPSESRRAKRMMNLEENAINGRPVSAERKAKLAPKPKAKVRAKRAKAAIAEATAAPPPPVQPL